jgi:D-psicose/D-tagatose/L-ribulose 3-epimerase
MERRTAVKPQNFQVKDRQVIEKFVQFRKANPKVTTKLNLSWSNWGFGIEPFERSIARLARNKVPYVELHGNRYGPDLGYKTKETKKILDDHGVKVSGVCGMVSPECELSSNNPHITQRSIDYFRRNIDMCAELGGSYVLFAPGAVGRPKAYDENEFHRSAEAIRILGDHFVSRGVRAAIEPVRAAETSFCHTFREAKRLIDTVNHPGVRHIAGDMYHMYVEEEHVSATILEYGLMMTNLHTADSNRMALGLGSLDLDLVLMALYAVGYNNEKCFCSAEPLGPGGDPYPQMFGNPDPKVLDALVEQTARYFYEREREILSVPVAELER